MVSSGKGIPRYHSWCNVDRASLLRVGPPGLGGVRAGGGTVVMVRVEKIRCSSDGSDRSNGQLEVDKYVAAFRAEDDGRRSE